MADESAPELVEMFPPGAASLVTASNLNRTFKAAVCSANFSSSRFTIGGNQISAAEISGVVSSIAYFLPQEFYYIQAADREYVCAEVSAFFIYFLSELRCKKLNPPTSKTLSGLGMQRVEWMKAAHGWGVPVWPTRLRNGLPVTIDTTQDVRRFRSTIVGDTIVEHDTPDRIRDYLHTLSRASSMPYLCAEFASPRGGGILSFRAVDRSRLYHSRESRGDRAVLGSVASVILLWGTMDDEPMAMAHAALSKAGADFVFLDFRKIFTADIDYEFDPERGARCTVSSDQATIDMARVNAAYVRGSNLYDYDEVRVLPRESTLAMRAARFESTLTAWLDSSDALVINRSGPSATNNSKAYQMTLIGRAGFLVPEAFISNDPIAVRAFLTENPDAVYKSISGIRSIVRRVGERQRDFLDDVTWCPTLFQRVVSGVNYRAHVLGASVLAVRIDSDQLDYRYGSSTIAVADLPAEVADRCRRITAILGLHFSGIDLIRTPEDRWYCLEVNPSPAYSYFERGSGQPISAAFAKFMMDADERGPMASSPKP